MKQIYFIRSAPYKYQADGMTLYQSFNAVIKKEIQPKLLPGGKEYLTSVVPQELFAVQSAYTSEDPRCIETAKFFASQIVVTPFLQDLNYEMENFMSEKDFQHEGKPNVTKARMALIQALVEDRLQDSFGSLLHRITNVLDLLQADKATAIACVSHGFFIKLIEIYLRHPEIEHDPKSFLKYYTGSQEAFGFCEGFVVTVEEELFKVSSSIKKND